MNPDRIARALTGTLVVASVALTTACFNSFNHGNTPPDDSLAQQVLVMVNVDEDNTNGTSNCTTDVNDPTDISGAVVYNVPSGSLCYFRYTAGRDGINPTFQLTSNSGDANLYVDFKNDTTGGTAGDADCTTTTTGGGWDRCSRSSESQDRIDTNESGILTMNNGDLRLLGVYGAASGDSTFTLEVSE
jgi:hypothetical protein